MRDFGDTTKRRATDSNLSRQCQTWERNLSGSAGHEFEYPGSAGLGYGIIMPAVPDNSSRVWTLI